MKRIGARAHTLTRAHTHALWGGARGAADPPHTFSRTFSSSRRRCLKPTSENPVCGRAQCATNQRPPDPPTTGTRACGCWRRWWCSGHSGRQRSPRRSACEGRLPAFAACAGGGGGGVSTRSRVREARRAPHGVPAPPPPPAAPPIRLCAPPSPPPPPRTMDSILPDPTALRARGGRVFAVGRHRGQAGAGGGGLTGTSHS